MKGLSLSPLLSTVTALAFSVVLSTSALTSDTSALQAQHHDADIPASETADPSVEYEPVSGNSDGAQEAQDSSKADKEDKKSKKKASSSDDAGGSAESGENRKDLKTEAPGTESGAKTAKSSNKARASSGNSSGSQKASKKVWVEPVYKTVHHDETGHYETIEKYKCPKGCGTFDTYAAAAAHQQWHIEKMRETDPDFVCDGRFSPRAYYTQVYVVDREAYDETILVKEGYWK